MPQLDLSIISSQVFWLILTFFILYTILTHFFLPNFIKVLKTRKHVLTENIHLATKLKKHFEDKQNVFIKIIEYNLTKIKYMVEKEICTIFKNNSFVDFNILNEKVSNALYSNLVLYDITILRLVSSKPMVFKNKLLYICFRLNYVWYVLYLMGVSVW